MATEESLQLGAHDRGVELVEMVTRKVTKKVRWDAWSLR